MVNYFELYGLPLSFRPDQGSVERKFHELGSRFSPGSMAAGQEATAEAQRMSALNEDAYRILQDGDSTMEHVLQLHAVLEEQEQYSLSPDFLVDLMELNEELANYELDPEEDRRQMALEQLEGMFEQWREDVAPLIEKYESGDHTTELLHLIKECYFQKKYLLRIKERIDSFAPDSA